MEVVDNMYIRYFMFSHEHYNKILDLEKKSGNRNYQFGKVLVSGVYKRYTYMTRDPETYSRRYSDAKVVASGDIRKIRYTEPE